MKDIELFHDSFQNWKKYLTCKAQLVISDVPYVIGKNAFASNPSWYKGGDLKNGESELANSYFFYNDNEFRPAEFMHFCSKLLVKEPKVGVSDSDEVEKVGGKIKSKAPCMILFCAFDQLWYFIELGKRYGFMHYIPLVFRKNYSAQVLKANMKVVGNCEYGLILYKDKLPKFNNEGRMIFNCMDYPRDNKTPKVHPTQKSVPLLMRLIELFTDPGDVVIDPCAGSGSTLLAAGNLGRKAYGFEVNEKFFNAAHEKILPLVQPSLFSQKAERQQNTPPRIMERNPTQLCFDSGIE
jgi:site-specific DNA-methyltransferase (adenine-specific)